MQTIITLLASLFFVNVLAIKPDFLTEQKKSPRTRSAYQDKQALLNKKLKEIKMSLHGINILITAYKDEKEMDVFVKRKEDWRYQKFGTYAICARSGNLGPKRKRGDYQVPEGFYYVDRFNPGSDYYLSLGINYPNRADKIKSKTTDPGGDIFIHGACVTIGCLPMTNDKMKEIYILAIQARQSGQSKIPVYIFPYRFTQTNISRFKSLYKTDKALLTFWDILKTGYDRFHETMMEVKIKVDAKGNYSF